MTAVSTLPVTLNLTIPHAAELHSQWRDALARGVTVLDLSAVGECDSSGVQLLCAALRSARQLGQALQLQAPSEAVRDALRRCGLNDTLQPLCG